MGRRVRPNDAAIRICSCGVQRVATALGARRPRISRTTWQGSASAPTATVLPIAAPTAPPSRPGRWPTRARSDAAMTSMSPASMARSASRESGRMSSKTRTANHIWEAASRYADERDAAGEHSAS